MYQEYLKRGHTIANHTYSHGIKRGLYNSEKTFIDSVKKQEDLINSQTGYITNIVRFPGGSATAGKLKNSIIEELRKNNYVGLIGPLRMEMEEVYLLKSKLGRHLQIQ